MAILLCGCLFPGSPVYFNFKSKNPTAADSLVVISLPHDIDYQYKSKNFNADSILLINPITSKMHRMKPITTQYADGIPLSYQSAYVRQWWNLKKLKKTEFIALEKHIGNKLVVDTFYKANNP
jgi:hypothetical protein